jgi:hypothetical protein
MPHVKLLLDENLSPAVAVELCRDGLHPATPTYSIRRYER